MSITNNAFGVMCSVLVISSAHAYMLPEAPVLPTAEDEKVKVSVKQTGRTAVVTLNNNSSYRLTYAYVGCNIDDKTITEKKSNPFFRDIFESEKTKLIIQPGQSLQKNLDTKDHKITDCFTGTLRGHLADPEKIAQKEAGDCREKIHKFLGIDYPFGNRPLNIQPISGQSRYRVEYVEASKVVRRTVKCFPGVSRDAVAFDD